MIDANAMSATPNQKYCGAASTKNKPATAATNSNVATPSQALRLPVASALCPKTGARIAIKMPAAVIPHPKPEVRLSIAAL